MMGKFFLLALVGVSLVQGNNNLFLEGYRKVYAMHRKALGTYESVREEIHDDMIVIAVEPQFVANKSERAKNQAFLTLENIVRKLEVKAKDSKNPEAVIECIKAQEKICREKLEKSNQEFKSVELKKVARAPVPKVDSLYQYLGPLLTDMSVKLFEASQALRACEDRPCINNVVDLYEKWTIKTLYPTFDSVMHKSRGIMKDFEDSIESRFETYSNSVRDTGVAAKAAMEQCLK